tara:strand:- start:2014 stop:2148 length:135 start_codon:yes stop_codon:yes gene_type:complete
MECIDLVNKVREYDLFNQTTVMFLMFGMIFMAGIMFEKGLEDES